VAASIVESSPAEAHGTAVTALRNRNFRIIWLGLFASNIGTWMQTVALPAYIDSRTQSGGMVGWFIFAQLGPLLVLSIPGGVLADRFPRKPWIATMQVAAMVLTVAIAWLVSVDASVWSLFGVQLAIGIANALSAPAMQGVVPALVDRRDLPGVVSLNSVMINGSRVLGPIIGAGLVAAGMSIAGILVINAVTYVAILVSLSLVTFPTIGRATEAQGWRNVTTGLRIAWRRRILARILIGMATFSILCLPFVGLFPTIARLNFGLDPNTDGIYNYLYATWGLGAMVGALLVGTVLAKRDHRRLVTPFLVGFAGCLAAFALVRSPGPAFPIGFALGLCYFAMTTCMMTVLQQNLRNEERARVMSLWFMSFGGAVAIGNPIFGRVMDEVGATPVLLMGAAVALALSWFCNLAARPGATLADESPRDQPPLQAMSIAIDTDA
jgi:MFS family permease